MAFASSPPAGAGAAELSRVAYLHGFASGPRSYKGLALREKMGEIVCLPDLNNPSFDKVTITGALQAMDALHEEVGRPRWKLVGSSMGGHVAAVSHICAQVMECFVHRPDEASEVLWSKFSLEALEMGRAC